MSLSLSRVRALVVLGVLGTFALVSTGWAITHDNQVISRDRACASAAADTAIPAAKAVRIRVFNATDRPGLASEVRTALTKRGFVVVEIGNDPQQEVIDASAHVRFGPLGAGAAQLLRANIRQAEPVSDERKDATVDVVLGAGYTGLTPPNEVQSELDHLGPVPTPSLEAC